MNLNQFYVSQSTATTNASMKVPPRRNLQAAEVPLMSTIHLRRKDLFDINQKPNESSSSSSSSTPDQSLLIMLAINAAKAQSRTNLNKEVEEGDAASSPSVCPFHSELPPEEKEELIPEEYQKKVRSIVGFIPLLKRSEAVPPSPSPHLSPNSSRNTSNLFPPPSRAAAAASTMNYFRQPTQDELLDHWNNTIGKSFLRNSASSVPMFPEVWVLIPFDTIVERFLEMMNTEDDEEENEVTHHSSSSSSTSLEQDFVKLVLKRSSSLRQRVTSHLIGQLRELPVAAVSISCKIVVNVLRVVPTEQDSSASFPKIVKELEIEHEYHTVKKWLHGCSLEVSASCESGEVYWIYGSPHPSLGISSPALLMQQQYFKKPTTATQATGEVKEEDSKMNVKQEEAEDEEESTPPVSTKKKIYTKKTTNIHQKKGRRRKRDDEDQGDDVEDAMINEIKKEENYVEMKEQEDGNANLTPPAPQIEDETKNDDDDDELFKNDNLEQQENTKPPPFSTFQLCERVAHIINPTLFSSSTRDAINNCNYCQDELLDRLSYKHSTVNLTRIVIPTLLSYGLNVNWIDDEEGRSYFYRRSSSSMKKTLSSASTSVIGKTMTRAEKLLMIAKALRSLKQAYVCSFVAPEPETMLMMMNWCVKFKIQQSSQQHQEEIMKLSCRTSSVEEKNNRLIKKVWRIETDKMGVLEVEPHRFRVNIDEKNLKIKIIFMITTKNNEEEEVVLEILDVEE